VDPSSTRKNPIITDAERLASPEDVMERREFLKVGTAAGLIGSTRMLEPLAKAEQPTINTAPIPRRALGKTGEKLSIVGFAGIVVMDNSPSFASNIVAEAVDRGINYF